MIDGAIVDGLARDIGPAGAKELCELWRTDSPSRLLAIGQSIEDGDAVQVARIAHGLKSASALVGAVGSAQLCADIEGHARDGRLDLTRTELAALTDELRQESCDLAAYVTGRAP